MARNKSPAPAGIRITAAICSVAGREPSARCIESVLLQSLPAEQFEVLLVGSAAAPPATGTSRVRRIDGPVDDLPGARNLALREARAKLIAFLDANAVATPDWLAGVCAAFEQFGELAHAVGGRVRPLWGAVRPAWLADGLLPTLSILDLGGDARFLVHGERLNSVNMAFRTDVAMALGGFAMPLGYMPTPDGSVAGDERRLLDRIAAAAGRVVFAPAATVDYAIPEDCLTQDWFRRRAAWQAVHDLAGSTLPTGDENVARWQNLKDFFYGCPPADRTIRSLVLDVPDPRRFEAQVTAIYDCITCLLSGATERDDD
jgi:hypothetical protein